MRLLAIVSFGIAVLGLFTIFNSTSVPISPRRLYYVHRGYSARCPVIADRIVSKRCPMSRRTLLGPRLRKCGRCTH
jgi:hypothetical protein